MPHPPGECRASRAGEAIGRSYTRTTAALAAPIRRCPAPTWPRHRVRAGMRRAGTAPRRLLDGLRKLFAARPKKTARKGPAKARAARYGTGAFLAWWGGQWAAAEGVLPWIAGGAGALLLGVAYARGDEPEPCPQPRRPRAAPPAPGQDAEQPPADDAADPAPAPEEPPAQPRVHPLLALTAQLIGDARGVHLDALTAAVNQAAPNRPREAAEVRAALAQLGVHTRPSVGAPEGAVPGAPRRTRRGVHRADLETVTGPLSDLSPTPPPAPIATAATPVLTCGVAGTATPVAAPATAATDTRESA